MNYKLIKSFLVYFLTFFVFLNFAFSENKNLEKTFFYKIIIEKNSKKHSSTMLLMNGKGYLNVEDIAKFYGAELTYKQISKEVLLDFKDKNDNINRLKVLLGKSEIYLNSDKIIIDRMPFIYGTDIYLPLVIFLGKNFNDFANSKTTWNPEKAHLKITKIDPNTDSQSSKETIDNLNNKNTPPSITNSENNSNISKNDINKNNKEEKLAIKSSYVNNENKITEIPKTEKNMIQSTNENNNTETKNPFYEKNQSINQLKPENSSDEKKENIVAQNKLESNESENEKSINNKKKKEKKEKIKKEEQKKEEIKKEEPFLDATPREINLKKEKIKIKKINTIIVDAGHGGHDPGAHYDGVQEKDINLSVAKKLKQIFEEKYSKKVIMTRDTDIFIPLRERTEIANKNNGDIFISIHSNAAPNRRDWNGFEVYFLSENASDKEAENVAKLENAVINLEEKINTDINTILWSMMINEYMNESSTFCHFISKNISSNINNLANRGVKQAGFMVLKGSKMPSVLIELGYMTNKNELNLLVDENFQTKMAESIAQSVIDYEEDKISASTKIAA
jgi:N-acetylmuramoyl-L-alanine amidase